jgi:hypothetical protein
MGGTLRVNAIVWSPLTTPLKAQLCYDQTDKSATCPAAEAAKHYPYRRAALNRILKDTILDDCLADAMIYQGRSRDEMNAQMREAILQAAATSGGKVRPANLTAAAAAETAPLVVVTESLGSKIAFDAIYKLSTDTDAGTAAAGNALFDRTTQIFMGANQLPILALADRQLDGSVARARALGAANAPAPYPEDPIAALASRRAGTFSAARAAAPLRVVAFTDPNDLLSYVLVPSAHAQMGYSVVDVVVSNANTYLGLAELPTTAHLGYRNNEAVRRLIACGLPRSALCKP